MATFTQWLDEQRDRQDAVGWFARYWKNLEGKPRLSSPSSIAQHLEDREAGGFRDPHIPLPEADGSWCAGDQLREAYDATLKEYRAVRAQIVQSTAEAAGVPQVTETWAGGEAVSPPLPGMPEPGPAAQAVQRASAAGLAAAQAHGQPVITENAVTVAKTAQLDRIEAKLDAIMVTLGLAEPPDADGSRRIPGTVLEPRDPAEWLRQAIPAITGQDWAGWYEQAAVFAAAHGPGWDEETG
jgi:hypothetical protein